MLGIAKKRMTACIFCRLYALPTLKCIAFRSTSVLRFCKYTMKTCSAVVSYFIMKKWVCFLWFEKSLYSPVSEAPEGGPKYY